MSRRDNYAGCFIYVRISAADIRRARAQARGNPERLAELIAEKLDSHRAECLAYAQDEQWPVLGLFDDNMVSGNARYRGGKTLPGRDRLLAALRERAGQRLIVLSTEVARLYRDMGESRQLVEIADHTDVTVVSTDGEEYDLSTAEGESRFNGAVDKAQRESAKVSERRRDKEADRAQTGGYWGNEPFGYHKVYEYDSETGQRYYTGRLTLCTGSCCELAGQPGCTHHGGRCWLDPRRPMRLGPGFGRPDPLGESDSDDSDGPDAGPMGEAELIRIVAQHVAGGASLGSAVRSWEAIGVTTRTGRRWQQVMMRGMLLNRRLQGVRVHRAGNLRGRADRNSAGTETPGQWPAILDENLADAVRGVLTHPERYKHVKTGHTRGAKAHLLAGLAECGNVLGPEFGVRAGETCAVTMKGHPTPRTLKDGTRARQYICPKVNGGCGHCRRDVETADRWVIQHVLAWVVPGGPYEEFTAAERAAQDASREAVAAEVAALQAEQDDLGKQRDRVNAAIAAGVRSGDIVPGDEEWKALKASGREVDDEISDRAVRRRKLLETAQPDPLHERHDEIKAVLMDPAAPVAVRAELVRRLVAKVIIRPPGQGTRKVFDPATIEVVPGPWADGIAAEALAIPAPAGVRTVHTRDAIAAHLAVCPGATAREVAEACRLSHSQACTVLARMRDAGEVTGDRERGTGRAPVHFQLAG
jgi:DNA invertase Pin-like site-specific DNA recombinase